MKLYLLLAVAMGAIATAILLKPSPAIEPPGTLAATRDIAPQAAITEAPIRKPSVAENLPGAVLVEDVDIIGDVSLFADGSLEYTLALRHLFDHFLGLAGNAENIPSVGSALARHLESEGLDTPARQQVLDAFNHYTDYLRAAEQVQLNSYEAGDLERTFEVLFTLRRSILGNRLADAFFSEDEAREQAIVAQRRIATDRTLSATERERYYTEVEESLPPAMQEARRQATEVVRLRQDTAALRQGGASESVIQQMREQQVGFEAAERLAELDRSRAEWRQRLQTYQREREALLAISGPQTADQQQALTQLRRRLFSEQEVRRVAAMEGALH